MYEKGKEVGLVLLSKESAMTRVVNVHSVNLFFCFSFTNPNFTRNVFLLLFFTRACYFSAYGDLTFRTFLCITHSMRHSYVLFRRKRGFGAVLLNKENITLTLKRKPTWLVLYTVDDYI